MASRYTARKVTRKATPAPKRARRRHLVVERERAQVFWDGSRRAATRRTRRGRGGIVQAITDWVWGTPGHAGRSRGQSWW